MFGFPQQERLSKDIGVYLHRNIREALSDEEHIAVIRVTDMFTSAFLYSLVEAMGNHCDLDGEKESKGSESVN